MINCSLSVAWYTVSKGGRQQAVTKFGGGLDGDLFQLIEVHINKVIIGRLQRPQGVGHSPCLQLGQRLLRDLSAGEVAPQAANVA
jgi:hypothetical protein